MSDPGSDHDRRSPLSTALGGCHVVNYVLTPAFGAGLYALRDFDS
jgi:hypothetical protein